MNLYPSVKQSISYIFDEILLIVQKPLKNHDFVKYFTNENMMNIKQEVINKMKNLEILEISA